MTDVDEAAAEAARKRMAELGRKGGKASGEARRRKGKTLSRAEILEIARRSDNAYGVARLLAELPPEESKAPLIADDRSASFVDLLRTLHEAGALEAMLVEAGVLEPEDTEAPPGGGEGASRKGGGAGSYLGSPEARAK